MHPNAIVCNDLTAVLPIEQFAQVRIEPPPSVATFAHFLHGFFDDNPSPNPPHPRSLLYSAVTDVSLGIMATEAEKEISGLELLRQPATPALVRYLNDLNAVLGFQADLWRVAVQADYLRPFPKSGDANPLLNASAQMGAHKALLGEMLFCRAVNSFLTYIADLMTLIYEKYPKKLPLNKQTTYRFSIEHHLAGDLISAFAEETVIEKTHSFADLAAYFKKNLDLVLFKSEAQSENARLCVDIRNLITHNRGIVNRFFIQRHPQFANDLGKWVVLGEQDREKMEGDLGYCARQIDILAIKKFGLETIKPKFKEQ